jgi:hypothetical protein
MRRELVRHRTGLGRWFDGVVDVFLNLEEEFPDLNVDEDAEGRGVNESRGKVASDEQRGRGGMDELRELEEGGKVDQKEGEEDGNGNVQRVQEENADETLREGDVEAPPEHDQGVWGDVKWFGRLLARTVRS